MHSEIFIFDKIKLLASCPACTEDDLNGSQKQELLTGTLVQEQCIGYRDLELCASLLHAASRHEIIQTYTISSFVRPDGCRPYMRK